MDGKTGETGGKCPVMHGATHAPTAATAGGRSNRDWWPNALNLGILHQQDRKSVV